MNYKTCIITGATDGIGKATALELARQGYHIGFSSRNEEKGLRVQKELIEASGNEHIQMFQCDLASLKEVKQFAENVLNAYPHIDLLINNAGVLETTRKHSKDGFELTWAVNYLAHFYLTNLLVLRLEASAPARIINLSSVAYRFASMRFDDLECKNFFNPIQIYGQSKLAVMIFTHALAEKIDGTGVTVNCLHPGVVNTAIIRQLGWIGSWFMESFALTPERGAETTLYLATSADVKGVSGQYFIDKKPQDLRRDVLDAKIAAKLWEISEEMVGEQFPI